MSKRIVFSFFFVVFLSVAFGQVRPLLPTQTIPTVKNNNYEEKGWLRTDSGFIGAVRDTNFTPRYIGTHITWLQSGVDTTDWLWTGTKWMKSGGEGFDASFDATRPSTSPVQGIAGVTYGTTDIKSTLNAILYPSQPPIATLTGGVTQELTAAGADLSATLSYTAGRSTATQPLQTIIITSSNGQSYNKTFTQPNAPGSVSGTQIVTVPRNLTTTFTNTVTAADNRNASATTSFSFLPKRYWGMVATQSPTDANIIAQSSELSASRAKSWTVTPTANYYLFYAYPANEGNLTSLKVNTFESILSFTLTQRTFVNASGYSQLYLIYVANNATTVTNNQTLDAQ